MVVFGLLVFSPRCETRPPTLKLCWPNTYYRKNSDRIRNLGLNSHNEWGDTNWKYLDLGLVGCNLQHNDIVPYLMKLGEKQYSTCVPLHCLLNYKFFWECLISNCIHNYTAVDFLITCTRIRQGKTNSQLVQFKKNIYLENMIYSVRQ